MASGHLTATQYLSWHGLPLSFRQPTVWMRRPIGGPECHKRQRQSQTKRGTNRNGCVPVAQRCIGQLAPRPSRSVRIGTRSPGRSSYWCVRQTRHTHTCMQSHNTTPSRSWCDDLSQSAALINATGRALSNRLCSFMLQRVIWDKPFAMGGVAQIATGAYSSDFVESTLPSWCLLVQTCVAFRAVVLQTFASLRPRWHFISVLATETYSKQNRANGS